MTKLPTNKPPTDSPTPARREPRKRDGRRDNAVKHGAYLNEQKRSRRELRDSHRKAGEREGKAILRELGLSKEVTAQAIVRDLGRMEAIVQRGLEYYDRRGPFTRAGEHKAGVFKILDVLQGKLEMYKRLLAEARAARVPGEGEPEMVFMVTFGEAGAERCPECRQPLPLRRPMSFESTGARPTPAQRELYDRLEAEYQEKLAEAERNAPTPPPPPEIAATSEPGPGAVVPESPAGGGVEAVPERPSLPEVDPALFHEAEQVAQHPPSCECSRCTSWRDSVESAHLVGRRNPRWTS